MSDAEALAWLDRLLDLDAEQRSDHLRQLAIDNPALKARIERLLAAAEADDSSLALAHPVMSGLRAAQDAATAKLQSGQLLAGYRLIRELGRGGMSVVWLAERADGVVKREVALKLPLMVLDSLLDVDRFAREKDALAALAHPNIARLYDAGVTAAGQPFLVLEAVEGVPITAYCDREQMDIRDRLRLFRQVLDAVEHAHSHLIVHRDLKPSNVLVDVAGQVKLLDFGIAKILDAHVPPEGGALTVTAASLMTPEYASPEQFLGEAITTSTDVYSLGCVLYELLTGDRPLRVASRRPHEIAQAVLQSNPEKPSVAVGRATASRTFNSHQNDSKPDSDSDEFDNGSLIRLRRRLRGDLDNIVMKAIRKEPQARYASVSQFSEDLRRHLNAEPILARRNTLGYLAGKFVARNRLMVGAMALLLISIGVGVALTIQQARIARANQLRAEHRFNDVRNLANSLVFELHDEIKSLPGSTSARQLIILRAQEYLGSLAKESASDPQLLRELAAAYTRLASVQGNPNDANVGDIGSAIRNYRNAIALLEFAAAKDRSNPTVVRELAQSHYRLALGLARTGDQDGRKQSLERAVHLLETAARANSTDQDLERDLGIAYGRVGALLRDGRDLEGALGYYRKAHAIYGRLHTTNPDNKKFARDLSHSHRHLGTLFAIQNQYGPALGHYRAASSINAVQLALDPDDLDASYNVSLSDSNIGFVLGEQGDIDGALEYYGRALDLRSSLLAADPRDDRMRTAHAETLEYIGGIRLKRRDYDAALAAYKRALASWVELAKKSPANKEYAFETAWTQAGIGQTLAAMALDRKFSARDRVSLCRESRQLIEQSLPLWIAGQTQSKLGVGGPKELAKLRQAVTDCERVIDGK